MRTRSALAFATAAAVLAAACGKGDCPTAAANAQNQNMAGNCSQPATQAVAIRLNLCETCAHTSPSCSPDLHAVGSGDIFLDTRWEICADNSGCTSPACSFVTCQFSVPNGSYAVTVLNQAGNPVSFNLSMVGGAPTCSGSI